LAFLHQAQHKKPRKIKIPENEKKEAHGHYPYDPLPPWPQYSPHSLLPLVAFPVAASAMRLCRHPCCLPWNDPLQEEKRNENVSTFYSKIGSVLISKDGTMKGTVKQS